MDVSKSVYTSTTTNVTLTTDDIQDFIRNKFNISSGVVISVGYGNVINGKIDISWMETSTTH
jgi:hypothetical protein